VTAIPRPIAGAAHTRSHWARNQNQQAARSARKKRRAARKIEHRGPVEVTSISFLPTTFTTLFVLAVALLLGYI
jgi:hypothetical protein